MDDAELHDGIGEHALDGIGETFRAIDTNHEDVTNATVLQIAQHIASSTENIPVSNSLTGLNFAHICIGRSSSIDFMTGNLRTFVYGFNVNSYLIINQ